MTDLQAHLGANRLLEAPGGRTLGTGGAFRVSLLRAEGPPVQVREG